MTTTWLDEIPARLAEIDRAELRRSRRVVVPEGGARLNVDGRSLLDSWTRHRVFTEHWGHLDRIPNWAAVRTERAQYVEYYNDDFSKIVFREYYRLRRDPWELRNLLHDGVRSNDPDTGRLHAWITQYRGCSGTSCPGW